MNTPEYKHQHYLKYTHLYAQYSKNWAKNNPAKIRLTNKKWKKANKGKIKKANRIYDQKNRKEIQKKQNERRAKNPEYYRLKDRQKYWNNPEIPRTRNRKWKKNNPQSSNHYSIELQLAMNNVRIRDKNICQWFGCGLTHREAPIHVHHIFPRSQYPELELIEQYMICYCANHHGLWHRYNGDNVEQLLISQTPGYED